MTWMARTCVEGCVTKWIGETVEVGQDVGAACRIAVQSDRAQRIC